MNEAPGGSEALSAALTLGLLPRLCVDFLAVAAQGLDHGPDSDLSQQVQTCHPPAFAPVLKNFKRRFRETNTEEGVVMETVLAYAMDQAYTSSRRTLLSEYRNSEKVRRLIGEECFSSTPCATPALWVIAAATVLTSPE